MAKQSTKAAAPKGEGPFGHTQVKLLKFILMHPGCTLTEIKEQLFNDKKQAYVSNLIYENQTLIHVEKFDNTEMPSKYKIDMKALSELVDLRLWLTNGELKSLPAQIA